MAPFDEGASRLRLRGEQRVHRFGEHDAAGAEVVCGRQIREVEAVIGSEPQVRDQQRRMVLEKGFPRRSELAAVFDVGKALGFASDARRQRARRIDHQHAFWRPG